MDHFPSSRTPFKAQSATARNGLQLKVPAQNSQKCHFRGAGFRPSSHPPELKIYQFARRTELPQTVHFERQRVKRRSEADPSNRRFWGFRENAFRRFCPENRQIRPLEASYASNNGLKRLSASCLGRKHSLQCPLKISILR